MKSQGWHSGQEPVLVGALHEEGSFVARTVRLQCEWRLHFSDMEGNEAEVYGGRESCRWL